MRRHAPLAGVLLASAVLHLWAIGSLGWGNSYYSAAVKSMGLSWTNFLFGAYDPAGVVTVDKPPAALWPQVVSTKIFGLHGWAMILPQAILGVATVWLLYLVVRRWAGHAAGLVAAAVLTLTPISVAIDRDNNPDTLLILLLVAAAYALTRALQSGSGRTSVVWLCLCGLLIGAGFLTKMLAAWMVVPAFALAWLIGATGTWWARTWRLLVAGVVLVVSSLWWVALVAVWPGERPFIGGSTDGGAWDLVIGYNGLGRVFGQSGGMGGMGGGISFGGAPGWDRLFNDQVAGQIGWLLPACAIAVLVAAVVAVLHRRGVLVAGGPLPGSGWILWGGWLLTCGVVFSTQQGIFHPYYTSQLSPAVGALCGGLAVTLWRAHRAGARWALPVAAVTVAASAGWAFAVIARVPSWHGWLRWAVAGLAVVAVLMLVVAFLRRRLLPVAVTAALAAILLAPGFWSASVTWSDSATSGTNPTAGPAVMSFGRGEGGAAGGPGGFPGGFPSGTGLPGGDLPGGMRRPPGGPGGGGFGGGQGLTDQQRKILDYVVENAEGTRIALAVEGGAMGASAYILDSDATVIGMGGFGGMDNAPSVNQLQTWVAAGELRYVLGRGADSGMGRGGPGMDGGPAQQRADWLTANCAEVPADGYGGQQSADAFTASVLYDCAARPDGPT
jgi:4-amino-4-deoxy-L-arabinose transferase-like glycosyltransferase